MTKARTLADNYAADINQVSAGVGITGGGTSGTVTITNDMATSINAKGDLVVGTANDTYSRLAVASTAGYVLTVDSAEATGVKWAAVASSSGPAFKAKKSSNQTITSGAYVKVAYQDEIFDTDSCYDPTTNYRFTPNKAGYYQITIGLCINANSGSTVITRLYKNGANDTETYSTDGFTGQGVMMTSASLIYLNGSTDYIEVYAYHGGTSPDIKPDASQFSAVWIRS